MVGPALSAQQLIYSPDYGTVMVELTLDLEPELRNRLGAEAEAHGFDGVEEYVRWIVVHRPDSDLVSQQYPAISTRLERLEARIDDLEKGIDRGADAAFTRGAPGRTTSEKRPASDATSESEERWRAIGTTGSGEGRRATTSGFREQFEAEPEGADVPEPADTGSDASGFREPVESGAASTGVREPAEEEADTAEEDAEPAPESGEPTEVKDLFGPPEEEGADDDEIAEAVGAISLSDDGERTGTDTGGQGDGDEIDADPGEQPSLDLGEESTESDDGDA